MTGEVGTGKTLLVRWLLQLLKGPMSPMRTFLTAGCPPLIFFSSLQVTSDWTRRGKTKGDLLLEFGKFLINRHQQNLTTVLVVDEAHHLPAEVLRKYAF